MALTLFQLQARLRRRFGGRTDIDTQIVDALNDAIIELEEGPVMPWFLMEDKQDLVVSANTNSVALPSDFLVESQEVDSTYYRDSSNRWRALAKDTLSALIRADMGTAETPSHYALSGTLLYVFPTPTKETTLRLIYFRRSEILDPDANEINEWTEYAPLLVMTRAGARLAQELRYADVRTEFESEFITRYDNLRRMNIAREQANLDMPMGE